MRAFKWIFAALVVFGCAYAQQEARFVLLPASAAGSIAKEGTWKPTQLDIDGAEASISQVSGLRAEGWSPAIHIDHPERYFRQYVPIFRSKQRRLYVNAFCDEKPPADWRTRLFEVSDGATCYWQALYDPATKTYSQLTINARA